MLYSRLSHTPPRIRSCDRPAELVRILSLALAAALIVGCDDTVTPPASQRAERHPGVATSVASVVPGTVGQFGPNDPAAARAISPASIDCTYNFSSGIGEMLLKWCVSANGNLMQFESPAGFEHIRNGVFWEGYVVCEGTTVLGYDTGNGENGCSPVTVVESGPTSVTLRRTCGGVMTEQTFTTEASGLGVVITTKVTNATGRTLSDVRFARVFDPDNDNDFADDSQDASIESIWARDTHGVALTGISFERPTDTSLYGALDGAACSPASLPLPSTIDAWASVTYRLGSMADGASRLVRHAYRRL